MSLEYRVQPLTDFTIFKHASFESRSGVQFKAPWAVTLNDLERELDYLDASDVVLELDVVPSKIRKDGRLYADAKVGHPGVRLSFDTRNHGRMSFTCDTYEARWHGQMPDWQANVRAIVLTLKSLRDVGRHGATQGQEYAGFKALGAGSGATAMGGMTRDEATKILCITAEGSWAPGVRVNAGMYRRALAAAHPDRNAGNRDQWDRVEQAGRVLGVAR